MLAGHQNRVTSVAFSSDGKRLVSGSEDKTVKVWEMFTGRELISLKASETLGVAAVAMSPNRRHILCSAHDGTIKIWDAVSSDDLSFPRRSRPPESAAVKPLSRMARFGSEKPLDDLPITQLDFTERGECTISLESEQELPQNIPVGRNMGLRLPLETVPEEELHAEPKYASEGPLYATLRVGTGTDPYVTLVLDVVEGKQPRLYVDRNNDEDLTNDDVIETNDARTAGRAQFFYKCIVDVPYGEKTSPSMFSCSSKQEDPRELICSNSAVRQCKIRLDGTDYQLLILDDDHDGCYENLKSTFISVAQGKMKMYSPLERVALVDPFLLGEKAFRTVSLSADGTALTVRPFSPQEIPVDGPNGSTGMEHTLKLEPRETLLWQLDFSNSPQSQLEDRGAADIPHAAFAETPKETLRAEPEYRSDDPRYATLNVGDGSDREVTVVLDEVEGQSPRLYVDSNNDEDLSNDGPPNVPWKYVSRYSRNNEAVERTRYSVLAKAVDVSSAAGTIRHTFDFSWYADESGETTSIRSACRLARQCWVTCQGDVYWLLLINENPHARFAEAGHSYIFVGKGLAPSRCEWDEAVKLGEPFDLGGRKWQVGSLSPDAMTIPLRPWAEPDVASTSADHEGPADVSSSDLPDIKVVEIYLQEQGFVRALVKNVGKSPATEMRAHFYVDGNRESATRTQNSGNLRAGGEWVAGSQKLPAGTHVVKVVVDPDDSVQESDETNNSKEAHLSAPDQTSHQIHAPQTQNGRKRP